jgi:hypothetical protein
MSEREMTLEEWVNRLPEIHAARREYGSLRSRLAAAEARLAEAFTLASDHLTDLDGCRTRLAAAETELEQQTRDCIVAIREAQDRGERLAAAEADAAIGRLVRLKLTSGNEVPVERCTIFANEIGTHLAAAREGEK